MKDMTLSRRAFAGGLVATALLAAGHARAQTPAASPAPAAELILRIDLSGVSAQPESPFLQAPAFALYADGTVIQPAIVTAIFPPAAIAPLNSFTISGDAIDTVVQKALDAGLGTAIDVPASGGSNDVTTTFTLMHDGQTTVSTIAGLNQSRPPSGLDATPAAAFDAVQAFQLWINGLSVELDADQILTPEQPYSPPALQIVAFVPDADHPTSLGIPDTSAKALDWPLSTSLAELGAVYKPANAIGPSGAQCGVVSGSDANAVAHVAQNGNLLSPWKDHGKTYGLLIKPLLPGESGCQVPSRNRA